MDPDDGTGGELHTSLPSSSSLFLGTPCQSPSLLLILKRSGGGALPTPTDPDGEAGGGRRAEETAAAPCSPLSPVPSLEWSALSTICSSSRRGFIVAIFVVAKEEDAMQVMPLLLFSRLCNQWLSQEREQVMHAIFLHPQLPLLCYSLTAIVVKFSSLRLLPLVACSSSSMRPRVV
ncbi:Os01g0333100 [Oryza sativa Japonica Group]|uniref:Os01g0333100 protein n=1 Tax=Oryza sativa subsp. japonica TaxID=39947 RepID=A0A0P0V276_ORYSJ|nr:Os01g0333100 [Oryza sativa Japonica Group]